MNMNKSKGELVRLHREYVYCVRSRLDSFLKQDEAHATNTDDDAAAEWCTNEKSTYLEYMRLNEPTEYQNLTRVELNIF